MYKIVWLPEAADDLHSIRNYLASYDPEAAERFFDRLITSAESLSDFPNRGRPATIGMRELVTVAPYVLRYAVDEVANTVTIVHVRHGRQRR